MHNKLISTGIAVIGICGCIIVGGIILDVVVAIAPALITVAGITIAVVAINKLSNKIEEETTWVEAIKDGWAKLVDMISNKEEKYSNKK